jgi:predicted XRE-type DNA-binding protein
MKKSKNIGSSLDDFFEEEGLLEHCESIAAKRAFVQQFEQELKRLEITKTELAERMQTSRSSINRLLDPCQPSNLKTLIEATRAIGKHLQLCIV